MKKCTDWHTIGINLKGDTIKEKLQFVLDRTASMTEAAGYVGVSYAVLRNKLIEHGLHVPTKKKIWDIVLKDIEGSDVKGKLTNLLTRHKGSIKRASKEINVANQTLRTKIKELSIPYKKKHDASIGRTHDPFKEAKKWREWIELIKEKIQERVGIKNREEFEIWLMGKDGQEILEIADTKMRKEEVEINLIKTAESYTYPVWEGEGLC